VLSALLAGAVLRARNRHYRRICLAEELDTGDDARSRRGGQDRQNVQ
jgi:hypothetical protein